MISGDLYKNSFGFHILFFFFF